MPAAGRRSGLLAHGNDQASTGILLVSSPLCWISGVFQYLWTLVHGQIRVLVPVSDPVSILASIDKFKITSWLTAPPVLFTVGSEYENKYKNHYDISSLKTIFLGGSSTGADVHTAMEEVFGCKIIQFYGSTETGGVFGSGSKIVPPGALGTLLSDVELRLVNIDTGEDIPANVKNAVGEVRVRSKNLMLGYYKNPEATSEAFDEHGFFKTGDLAYEDEDGYFYFVDRIKEMIKYMNYQVATAEVEAVLLQHPGVRDACVVGRASPAHGELPTAFVSRADNEAGEALTEAELQAMVAEQLTDYKRLRGGVFFLDELPTMEMGKIARRSLKEMLKKL
ncbi:putative 4-coumarate--CoA ligase 2 [Frankliniella fusca]|uniref:4-coumarate--CoA ligase 2 n=1 Tax=Frankliniella fusca TaxID=407009 RepID=A0AAE1GWK4_9NEOP|nr:putative 4-coumarate--CoA ligase 2 [Frankliniella fusca]